MSKYWVIVDIVPARIYANFSDEMTKMPGIPFAEINDEPNGRKSVAAWLLSAHLG